MEPILHHYDMSPYSEKIRLIFGLKGARWRSVQIPAIMPKPDLTPLTGGYRRTPVMQHGADIYCDTLLIAQELERLLPGPSIFPEGRKARHLALGNWAERALFWPAARVVVGVNADHFPMQFHEDRAAMWGLPVNLERMKAAAPRYLDQMRALLAWVEGLLGDGQDCLLGKSPGYADLSLYHCLWFFRRGGPAAEALLGAHPAIGRWMARIAELGQGERVEMPAEEALDLARAAEPRQPAEADPGDPRGFQPGDTVGIMPEEFGRETVTGRIVALNPERICVRHADPRVGEVNVHFPRLGYVVLPATG